MKIIVDSDKVREFLILFQEHHTITRSLVDTFDNWVEEQYNKDFQEEIKLRRSLDEFN